MQKLRIVTISGGRSLTTPADSPSYTIVARTEGYTHDAKVWAVSIVQRPTLPKR
jgi:hypothetical protein